MNCRNWSQKSSYFTQLSFPRRPPLPTGVTVRVSFADRRLSPRSEASTLVSLPGQVGRGPAPNLRLSGPRLREVGQKDGVRDPEAQG